MTCNIFQHCKWLKVFGSLMVFVVTSLVAITAYAMIFISYWDKLGKEDNHYGIPIIGVFLTLVRFSSLRGRFLKSTNV
jgi:nucleoside recognition membrane protein YjiH